MYLDNRLSNLNKTAGKRMYQAPPNLKRRCAGTAFARYPVAKIHHMLDARSEDQEICIVVSTCNMQVI